MKYNINRAWDTLRRKKDKKKVEEVPAVVIHENIIDPGAITSVIMGSWSNCLYCGAEPDCRDHVVPTSMFFSQGLISKGSNPGPRVIACQDCNRRISCKYVPSLTGRCLRTQELLRTRFRKLLRTESWTEEDLKEYDHVLKSYITFHNYFREVIEKRLEWQNGKLYLVMRRQIREMIKELYPNNKWLNDFVKLRKDQMKDSGNYLV